MAVLKCVESLLKTSFVLEELSPETVIFQTTFLVNPAYISWNLLKISHRNVSKVQHFEFFGDCRGVHHSTFNRVEFQKNTSGGDKLSREVFSFHVDACNLSFLRNPFLLASWIRFGVIF